MIFLINCKFLDGGVSCGCLALVLCQLREMLPYRIDEEPAFMCIWRIVCTKTWSPTITLAPRTKSSLVISFCCRDRSSRVISQDCSHRIKYKQNGFTCALKCVKSSTSRYQSEWKCTSNLMLLSTIQFISFYAAPVPHNRMLPNLLLQVINLVCNSSQSTFVWKCLLSDKCHCCGVQGIKVHLKSLIQCTKTCSLLWRKVGLKQGH